jgi:hypothetical protein
MMRARGMRRRGRAWLEKPVMQASDRKTFRSASSAAHLSVADQCFAQCLCQIVDLMQQGNFAFGVRCVRQRLSHDFRPGSAEKHPNMRQGRGVFFQFLWRWLRFRQRASEDAMMVTRSSHFTRREPQAGHLRLAASSVRSSFNCQVAAGWVRKYKRT